MRGSEEEEIAGGSGTYAIAFRPEEITVGACHVFRLGGMKVVVCREQDGTIKIFVVEKEHY